MGTAVSSSHCLCCSFIPRGRTPHTLPLLQCGLLSLHGHSSCQEPAPAQAPQGVTDSFGHPPTPRWGPPRAAGGDLLRCGPPWAAGGQPAPPWSAPRAAGKSLLRCLRHLLPSFCTDLGVCRVISLTYSHSSLLAAVVFPSS